MCGIAGVFASQKASPQDIQIINQMNELQKHRGPDDQGLFKSEYCILGHRRLAIIDLSKDGKQPMCDITGRYWITYNGEIYNYIELKSELRNLGWSFHTKTDTEVLLNAFIQFGENCLNKLNGMFAFAIYDTKTKQLFLARDRFGIKPLYYFRDKEKLYFASELKALVKTINFTWNINRQAVFDFFAFKRTDIFEKTFIDEIKRLPKGHFAILNKEKLHIRSWWSAMDHIPSQTNKYSLDKIALKIEKLFLDSVRLRMRSDVPVGSCLSGGLDSSIMIGVLYHLKLINESFQTFTASFPGYPFDETKYIEDLKKLYPIKNHRVIPTKEAALSNLNKFVYQNDEPLPTASFYTQYEVLRLAKNHNITVLLDGQGGDENFAGYHYFHGFNMYGLLRKMKLFTMLRELIQCILRKQDPIVYKTLFYQTLPAPLQAQVIKKSASFLKNEFFDEHVWKSKIFLEFFDASNLNISLARHFQYKLEHLLRSEDRNSMAFSLECRVPYLDHRLVESILNIPGECKIKVGETKWLQKLSLGCYTSSLIRKRKDKVGYGTPMEDWMRSTEWEDHTKQSTEFVREKFPDIFHDDIFKRLGSSALCWQINNFTAWYHQIFKK